MSSKKIIVVTGATGEQGGSVAKFLLEDGTFAVRAVTRNPSSPAAQALVKAGAEVVQADFDHPTTIEKAFTGAYGVFGNTNFWEPGVGEKEREQGKLLVDVAKKTGIKHFVWSSLEALTVDGGKQIPHWKTKHDVYLYLKASGVPYTNFLTTWQFENLVKYQAPQRTAEGLELNTTCPRDTIMPGYSARDNGGWALAIFKNPEEWVGKDIKIASQDITPTEICATLSEVLGEPVKNTSPTMEEFLASPYKGEFWLNMKVFVEYQNLRDIETSKRVYPGLLDFKAWCLKYKDELKKLAA